MAYLVSRKVKGKTYYYLEQNIRIGKEFKKFSEYLGHKKPTKTTLGGHEKNIRKQIEEYYQTELVKQGTEFIDVKTAKSLERIKQETTEFIQGLSTSEKKKWLEAERDKFITNTNAIEGSTLTLDETKKILHKKIKIGSERERLEVLNMEKCLERYDQYLKIDRKIDDVMILQLHYILLNEVPDYDKYKGIWRPVDVEIRTSKFEFPHFKHVPALMKKLIEQYNKQKQSVHPVELAAKLHCSFTTIHPFADGNGRMARLLMNYILQKNGFPFTNIPVKKRDEYFQAQEEGHNQNYKGFTKFLVEQIKENYRQIQKH
ncbi:MAG: Fic family protein [Candidatus Diapherotrites archaeon]|nr:Fic family protein [Candidatus Diapherotrites archaeon]